MSLWQLGGFLFARSILGAIPLFRLASILGCGGVGLLAIPLHYPPLAIIGMACIDIGSTIPYTSVFNQAAQLHTVSKGMAHGLVSVIQTPTVLLGPPLIGFIFDQTHDFNLRSGSIV